MSVIASQITSVSIVYSTVYPGADQRKHESSASLVFVRGIHRWPVNSPHKGPVTRKMFPFDDVIMGQDCCRHLDCWQATSHYLNLWWPKLMTYKCVTRPQWEVNFVFHWCKKYLKQQNTLNSHFTQNENGINLQAFCIEMHWLLTHWNSILNCHLPVHHDCNCNGQGCTIDKRTHLPLTPLLLVNRSHCVMPICEKCQSYFLVLKKSAFTLSVRIWSAGGWSRDGDWLRCNWSTPRAQTSATPSLWDSLAKCETV